MEFKPKNCEDHRTQFLGVCPFCEDGVEPYRFREARDDFRHVPLAGTLDVLPHHRVVMYEDVVSTLGQQLADVERAMAAATRPYEMQKATIHQQMRLVRLDPKPFSRAVRIHIGLAREGQYGADPATELCLEILRKGGLK